MTIEEISKGLGVPVSMEAYVELDALYLGGKFETNEEFIKYVRKRIPYWRDRRALISALELVHDINNCKTL